MSSSKHEITLTGRTRIAAHRVKKRQRRATTVPVTKVLPAIRRDWDAFEGSLRKSLERAIKLGKSLIEAKAKLPHGQFGKLFSDHKEPVEGVLPFTSRWAQKLVVLSGNEVLSNPNLSSGLPAELNTVYELSLMTAPALEAAIESGEVTPQTTREQAKVLRKEAAGEPATPSEQREKPPKRTLRQQRGAAEGARSWMAHVESAALYCDAVDVDVIRADAQLRHHWLEACREATAGIRRLQRALSRAAISAGDQGAGSKPGRPARQSPQRSTR